MKQVQEYFKDFPASNQCFTTSDGLVFHERGDANLYAQSLKDKEVQQHKRGTETPKEKEPVGVGKDAGAEQKPVAPLVPTAPKPVKPVKDKKVKTA